MRIVIDTEELKWLGLYDKIADILNNYGRPLDEEEVIEPYWLSIGDIRPKDKEAHDDK